MFGHLLFRAQSKLLSIAPESSLHRDVLSDPMLRRCRILNNKNWIGSIFLTPECAASNPTITHDCEFIRLPNCGINIADLKSNLLEGFSDWETPGPDTIVHPKTHEPAIFDPSYYESAKSISAAKSAISLRPRGKGFRRGGMDLFHGGIDIYQGDIDPHSGIPEPPKIYLSHVMLLERKGGSVYRKAVGLVVQNEAPNWPLEYFCLG